MAPTRKILYAASTAGHLRSFHLPYLRALVRRGWDVTACAAGEGDGLPEGVRFLSVPFTKRFLAPANLRAALLLAREIRAQRFDVIVTHTSLAAFFTRLGVTLAGKGSARVVNTVHGYLFDEDTPLLRRTVLLAAEKLAAGVTDDLLVMNETDLAIARQHRLCRGEVSFIPGMGVDLTRLAPASAAERASARAALALPEDAVVLLCAAEFSARKNQAVLLRALASLPEDVLLLLPGDGALRGECEALARTLGLESRTRFPGHVSDVRPYLRAADLCVSASRSEGLPFSVMEAMACGLPCVLSDVKGHRDLLREGQAGVLVPFGDPEALAAAAAELRADPLRRAALGAQGRERVREYGLDAVLPRVLSLMTGE